MPARRASKPAGAHSEAKINAAHRRGRLAPPAPRVKPKRPYVAPEDRRLAHRLMRFNEAFEALVEEGWKVMSIAPSDGTLIEVIELGSEAVFQAQYVGLWLTFDSQKIEPVLWRHVRP